MSFIIVTSPSVSSGIDTKLFEALNIKVKTEIADFTFEKLSCVIFFPMILMPEHTGHLKPPASYKIKSKAYYIGKLIQFEKWDNANFKNKKEIALEFYLTAITDVPKKYLSESEKLYLSNIFTKILEDPAFITI
jgi:hypothetical protein